MQEQQQPKTIAEMNDMSQKFKAAAEQNLQYARALDAEILAAEKAEAHVARDQALDAVSPVAKQALAATEVTVFINMAQVQGYEGFAEAAFTKIHKLADAAQNAEGAKIGAFTWGRDRVSQLDVSLANNLVSSRAGAETVSKHEEREDKSLMDRRMLPLAKKLLEWNTPDRQGDRARNYIIVTAASPADDNAAHTANLIDTVLRLNPRATVDLLVCGSQDGVAPVAVSGGGAKTTHVASVDGIETALNGILRERLNAAAPAVPVKLQPAVPAAP